MRNLRVLFSVVASVLAMAAPAAARTFTVNTTEDQSASAPTTDGTCVAPNGKCTLRAAVQEANGFNDGGADQIVVPAGAYNLTVASHMQITNSMAITGAGARETIVDATGDSRIFSVEGGTVSVSDLTMTGGLSQASGGAINLEEPSTELTLDRVSIRGNRVVSGGNAFGGGIYVFGGKITVRDSTISGNEAVAAPDPQWSAHGGALFSNGTQPATVTLENTTIANNTARGGNSTQGGGVKVNETTTLRHVTLVDNTAATGANFYASDVNPITLVDSIIAEPAGGQNCAGPAIPVKQGKNVFDDGSCGSAAGNVTVLSPALEPFGNYGGPTDTRPPTLGSPVLDIASSCVDSGHDQRGQPVPVAAACDVGAAELGADLSSTLTPSASSVAAGGSLAYVAGITNNGADATTGTLEFTPPPGSTVTFVDSLGGTCTGTSPVVCTYPTLQRGTGHSATIVVTAPASGPMTATSRVSGPVPGYNPGNDTAAATTEVTISGGGPGGGDGGGGGADTTPPVLSALKLVGKLSRTKGGSLAYTLSEDAKVTVRLDRLVRGRRKGGRCSPTARTGKRCTRAVKVGTKSFAGKVGTGRLKLPARWSGKRPRRGRHRLSITAVDAAGNRSAKKTLVVRIVA